VFSVLTGTQQRDMRHQKEKARRNVPLALCMMGEKLRFHARLSRRDFATTSKKKYLRVRGKGRTNFGLSHRAFRYVLPIHLLY